MKTIFQNILTFTVNLVSAFGLLWLIVELTSYFASDETVTLIKAAWWAFGLLGLTFAIVKQLPKNKYEFKVPQRDASIIVKRCDILKLNGALIVPINHKFLVNQDGDLSKSKSVLSQVVKKYYNSRPEHLQSDINTVLEKDFYQNYRDGGEYKIGTVVPVIQQEKKIFFLANTKLNQQNKSYCNDEIFEKSLNELWVFLSDCTGKDDFIIPLIGTGNGRLNTDREIIFKEILLSFLSSLSVKNYADSLTICFNPTDIVKYKINFANIGEFTKAKVVYQEYRNLNVGGTNENNKYTLPNSNNAQ